ncbi:MAG: TolC family protein, partial [Bacteroidota bacterium]|nr:TolC family protein [Bacteroidota bacterium]
MISKHVCALIAAILLLHCNGFAQVKLAAARDSLFLDEEADLQQQLIPLDSIIAIALQNSPAIKFQQDVVDADRYQVKFMQQQWTNDIAGFFNYSAGNQNLLTAGNQLPGSVTSSNISNGYRTGVQITLPLYEFIGRKARVNLYKATLQSSIDKRDQVKQDAIQFLIQIYYNLLYARNLMNIRSDAKQAAINQYQVGSLEFKDGIIPASELSRLKTIEANSRADFEEAKRQFSTFYFQFQNLIGVPMSQLM